MAAISSEIKYKLLHLTEKFDNVQNYGGKKGERDCQIKLKKNKPKIKNVPEKINKSFRFKQQFELMPWRGLSRMGTARFFGFPKIYLKKMEGWKKE